MQKENDDGTEKTDEELADILIAISVISKRLAKKITKKEDEKNE